jgi:hypothetical protein
MTDTKDNDWHFRHSSILPMMHHPEADPTDEIAQLPDEPMPASRKREIRR